LLAPLFETYSIGFLSYPLSHSYLSFFNNCFDPTCPFSVPSSSWPIPVARLEARFNTLHSNFTETQQEVRQLSANISTINKNMSSSITTSIEELNQDLKQDITTQLESVTMMICTKLHIPADPPLSDPPLHIEGETSSHSDNFSPITFSVTYAF
jgi:hypothetical protein